MAKQIYTAHFDKSEQEFKYIIDGIDNFIKRDENADKKASALLARDLAKTIGSKYTDYVNNTSKFLHGDKNIKISVTDTKKGCIVHISGKDILYEEYGTGSRGRDNPHPNHDADGMNPYGSGRNIIHDGERNNGHDIPYWYNYTHNYPTDFEGDKILPSDYVWRYKKTITKGLPAGKFIYDSCQEYKLDGEFDKHKILKQTITQAITKDIVESINSKIKSR